MKEFMDEDFLLSTPTAVKLYNDYAANLPIIDYHCHLVPSEIASDRRFENITQLWLGADHYKWRLMRSAGVDEKYITGNASDYEKFRKWAEVLGSSIGNPLYHWSHLELRRYFDYYGTLSEKTADEVWEKCNGKLSDGSFSAKQLIMRSNVETVCTTDDPADSLAFHREIASDKSFTTRVLPAWRPDKAAGIDKPSFCEYIASLSSASGIKIYSFEALREALRLRMDFFEENGCKVADHGMDYVSCNIVRDDEVERIFSDGLNGKALTAAEISAYKTAFNLFCGREYARRGWVMQLHYGVKRDNSSRLYSAAGADCGCDCILGTSPLNELADFLNELDSASRLPKTIIYSLNPNDNQAIETIMGCFQNGEAAGKLQHGAAWWFNDNLTGMKDHLTSLGNLGYLAGFVGMLTDSRSFLSYTRHEYFRRILCSHIGELVERGEFPQDYDILGRIVSGISYYNAKKYFEF